MDGLLADKDAYKLLEILFAKSFFFFQKTIENHKHDGFGNVIKHGLVLHRYKFVLKTSKAISNIWKSFSLSYNTMNSSCDMNNTNLKSS